MLSRKVYICVETSVMAQARWPCSPVAVPATPWGLTAAAGCFALLIRLPSCQLFVGFEVFWSGSLPVNLQRLLPLDEDVKIVLPHAALCSRAPNASTVSQWHKACGTPLMPAYSRVVMNRAHGFIPLCDLHTLWLAAGKLKGISTAQATEAGA